MIMESFLLSYVKELAEEKEMTLTNNQICRIVSDLMDSDELWDGLDSLIHNKLKEESSND